MKIKLKKSTQGLSLTLRSTGHEELIYPEAESVRAGASQVLLPFIYQQKKKSYEFQYVLGPAQKLEEMLIHPLSREYLEAILLSFLTLAKDCDTYSLSMQRVLFQHDYLFFDPGRYALVFVYVPLRSITENLSSALDALEYVSQHAKPTDASSQKLIQAVYDFAKRSAFFSWIEYERFLQEQGVLEKKTISRAPSIKQKDTQSIDCRESFGFDFVKEAAATGELEAALACAGNSSAVQSGFCLQEQSGTKSWSLKAGSSEIGSLPSADVFLADRIGVSRHHARIHVGDNGISIEDLDSTNGVCVNGKRIAKNQKIPLRLHDVIHIAREQFRLEQR